MRCRLVITVDVASTQGQARRDAWSRISRLLTERAETVGRIGPSSRFSVSLPSRKLVGREV